MISVVECSSAAPCLCWWKRWMPPPPTMCAASSPMMKSSHLSEYWCNCFCREPLCVTLTFNHCLLVCLFLEMQLQEGGAAAASLWSPWNHSHQCTELSVQVILGSNISQIATYSSPYANVVMTNNDVCRWTYIEFYSRYSILMSQQEASLSNRKQTCKNVLQRLIQVSLLLCCR